MTFGHVIEHVGQGIEAVGIAVILLSVVGSLPAMMRSALRAVDPSDNEAARRNVGVGILLGLEVVVAGDIARTVGVDPSFSSVGVLAIIVAIRTFLSFTISTEVNGRLPWQRPTNPVAGVSSGSRTEPGLAQTRSPASPGGDGSG